jgi:quinolinate synthase
VHPECRDDVVALADAALSTSGMIDYARDSESTKFLAVTECGLSDVLQLSVPDKQFYRACKICRFMKAISLNDVEASLREMQFVIELDEEVRLSAQKSLNRMFELTGGKRDNLKLPATIADE